ncbi:hypothetical protein ACFUEJ_22555 [Gordonia sp. NPDC057258]|uniref:hypothetical protein n=1 Tax=unclassified Gordonia (in: high G+C Gram-positive bacteria) TaxID=2657482 RepID=UPI00362BBDA0
MARGNKSIRDHREDDTALRLFVAVGNKPGTGTRIQQYIGQFAVARDNPVLTRTAPGADNVARPVFVFRLVAIGPVVVGDNPHTSTIESVSGAAEVATVAVDAVPVAALNTERSDVEKSIRSSIVQREAQLTQRFQRYLENRGREGMRFKIVPVGTPAAIYSDLADVTDNTLYEAKGSADRMNVRLALGQVLDYARYVNESRLAVLLPEPPAADLVELLEMYNVGCVVEKTPGRFVDMSTLRRWPLVRVEVSTRVGSRETVRGRPPPSIIATARLMTRSDVWLADLDGDS